MKLNGVSVLFAVPKGTMQLAYLFRKMTVPEVLQRCHLDTCLFFPFIYSPYAHDFNSSSFPLISNLTLLLSWLPVFFERVSTASTETKKGSCHQFSLLFFSTLFASARRKRLFPDCCRISNNTFTCFMKLKAPDRFLSLKCALLQDRQWNLQKPAQEPRQVWLASPLRVPCNGLGRACINPMQQRLPLGGLSPGES